MHSGGHRFEPDMYPLLYGGVAQLEERFVRTEEVTGSNPVTFHYGSVVKWTSRHLATNEKNPGSTPGGITTTYGAVE